MLDLVKKYLEFRAQNYALVVPNGILSWGTPETILKEYSLEEIQEEPDWYWTFDEGDYVFEDSSELAKQIKDAVTGVW